MPQFISKNKLAIELETTSYKLGKIIQEFEQELINQKILSKNGKLDFDLAMKFFPSKLYKNSKSNKKTSKYIKQVNLHHNEPIALTSIDDYKNMANNFLNAKKLGENKRIPNAETLVNLGVQYFELNCDGSSNIDIEQAKMTGLGEWVDHSTSHQRPMTIEGFLLYSGIPSSTFYGSLSKKYPDEIQFIKDIIKKQKIELAYLGVYSGAIFKHEYNNVVNLSISNENIENNNTYEPSIDIDDYYHNDPRRPQLNPNLEDFWKNLKRNNFLFGGRASGKTYDVASFLVLASLNDKLKIGCVRFIQNKITQSVYAVLKDRIEKFGLQKRFKFTPTSTTAITSDNGSEFQFQGLSRNLEEVKGWFGINYLWIEEANFLDKELWDTLTPTIREENSKIIATWNPKYKSDYMQQMVKRPPANTQIRKLNYKENPFLTKTMLDAIFDMENKDPNNHDFIYLGNPLGDDDRVFIRGDWIDACIDFELPNNNGEIKTVLDVGAGRGGDNSALCVVYGSKIIRVEEWNNIDVLESTEKAVEIAKSEDSDVLIYDNIGMGEAVMAELKKHEINSIGWNAGGSVANPEDYYDQNKLNRDHFLNIKSQSWQILADKFFKTYLCVTKNIEYDSSELISISSSLGEKTIEKLKRELSAPHREFNQNEQLKVESKESMKKRGVPSPNIADTIVMAFAPKQKIINEQMGSFSVSNSHKDKKSNTWD